MSGGFHIRPARLPGDEPVLLSFIDGLQAFEHGFEPNRRLDATVAAEHFAKLQRDVAERGGRILVADDAGGNAIGWAVVHEARDPVFVAAAERRVAYIAELFVVAKARGTGLGRALIGACEDWARERGIASLRIGVLPGNTRARAVYGEAGFTPYALELRKYLKTD